MREINKQLQQYVEEKILPIYDKNDSGHGIEHIKYVIKRSFEFANQFENIDFNIVSGIASYHEFAQHNQKDNHE